MNVMKEKIEALAKYLECDAEDIEEGSEWWGFTAFEVNPRRQKQGDPPEHYTRVIEKFKKLLTSLKTKQIAEYIEQPYEDKRLRDKLYYGIERYLKRYKTEKLEYAEIKKETFYIENVLYHLLSKEDKDFIQSYHNAFLGLPIEDNRELRQVDDGEYLVLTDEEADEACKEYIENNVWAFNSWFIIDHTDLPYNAREMIEAFQAHQCEEANEAILALIKNFDRFVDDAISADGRGHFLSGYDGEENEITLTITDEDGEYDETYYIYRVN